MPTDSKAIMYNYTFSNIISKRKHPAHKNVLDLLMEVCRPRTDSAVIADRTGTFLGQIKTVTEDIPAIPTNFNKTFEDICNERAAQLILTGKELLVTWSGGIDSTGVLVSLIKAAGSNSDQIKVMFERRSIDENSDFYHNHIKDKLNHEIFTEYFPNKVLPTANQLVVGGDNTAQIFGMSKTSFMDNRYEPWKPYVRSKLSDLEYNKYIEAAELQHAHAPFAIETVFDLHWWTAFSMRWTNPKVRVWRTSAEYTEQMFHNTIPFYGSTDFQIWSMLNHHNKLGNNPSEFKTVIKDIIYDYDHNDNYHDTMISITSGAANVSEDVEFNDFETFKNKIMNDEIPIMVDSNFNRHYRGQVVSNLPYYNSFISCFDENGAFNPDPIEWYTI